MGDKSPERNSGCCLITSVFWRRKTNLETNAPNINNDNDCDKASNTQKTKTSQGGSEDAAFLGTKALTKATDSLSPSNSKPSPSPGVVVKQNHQGNNPREKTSVKPPRVLPAEGYVNQGRRVPKEAIGISGELESMISDHQKSKGSSNLVRASSSNVMLFGNLGNLRQGGNNNNNASSQNVMDFQAMQREENRVANVRYTNNRVQNMDKGSKQQQVSPNRAISTRGDPEQLKILGNEDYKNGRFAEALALYDAAISVDPNKASYRSNKSAALTALGRLLEAVFECRVAIKIEPHYQRAHNRLGNLHMRLGETDKALYHYKQAGPEADPDEVSNLKNIQLHLNKCTEAHRLKDWNTLIKETNNAISSGADSAPQIFALQAEALLKLRRHQDADEAISRGPNFDVDDCTKFFGPIAHANLLVCQAQVDLAAGRFEDALDALDKAARLDSSNKDVNKMMRKARTAAAARSNGNELFKASKFSEASVAYGQGLELDPYNAVLLCNRAACRSKLGQFEKAVEDCNVALNLRPSYRKARLRRADCNAKLKRWGASIQDYEILQKETPEDEEVSKALLEVREQLKK
ncbi:hypothetical protein Lal_00006114 [Lupinus albus]|uniref:Putative acetyltransferase A, auxiliary subunit, methylthioribose-1-phosphate isomerase n=1 Tax=Lupinus albus TaxID=3870 RepID=A0A6A5MM85_LUPAL|nr:putative acetyltransferase A, auxiliary subunit, methylthioribose-1-phosphate isomerase [Lupinus albus]KAF1875486.1 hypothetical protein Lal_00006114 [Lupinus albus]